MNIPKHVAIILDGNGRWAKAKGMPRTYGHIQGAKTVEDICEVAYNMGIEYLTVYAFSTENWKRSEEEVGAIMDILRFYLKNYFKKFVKDDIRLHILGDKTRLAQDIQDAIEEIETLSKDKQGMTVHIALNYGGRDEIRRAVSKIAEKVADGELSPSEVTEDVISSALDTAGVPDPELLIRTSGEERISNFLLWQIAYSEFYFSEMLWPDFNKTELQKAIYYYQNRERRFGGRLK